MPRLPETIRVHVGPLDQEWYVKNVGECRYCKAQVYWCETLNRSTAPVDMEPDDQGLHAHHRATCTNLPRPRGGEAPKLGSTGRQSPPVVSGRDRAAGES